MSRLQLIIESEQGNVCLVALAANKICTYVGMNEIAAGQIELCVAEALTNVIRHAYHGASGKAVSITISIGSEHLQFDILDSGTPMSPEQTERLIQGAPLPEGDWAVRSSLVESGRGLQIIHDVMDRIAYFREGNTNCLQMTKRIGAPYLN